MLANLDVTLNFHSRIQYKIAKKNEFNIDNDCLNGFYMNKKINKTQNKSD